MITRRKAMQVLAGGAAGLTAAFEGSGNTGGGEATPALHTGSRRPGDKPNLLFVWTDQQRADTMAAYGNARFRGPTMIFQPGEERESRHAKKRGNCSAHLLQ